ncbi:unnamed protein product [Sphagnum jensenii]|uniref:Uncharacterized protein n=1 Tax=Sphagnum jensenii TaxID=128206 RepID=A0ABP0VJU3_9BRYO
MAKRSAGSRILGSLPVLTPDQKNSGIDPKYLAVDDVQHTVGKVSMRPITLLQPRLNPRSARKVMGLQSPGSPAGRDFGTPRREKPFGCGPRGESQSIL